jgi:transketolase
MKVSDDLIKRLEQKAREIRYQTVKTCYEIGPAYRAHPGPALSITDILVALYYEVMDIDPENPSWRERDRLVLSKGHACPSLYVILANFNFFPKESLSTLRHVGSLLQGHPDMRKTPGIDMTTGSLGHGLSAGIGMALAGKIDNLDYTTFVIIGDGELDEGIAWEAAGTASKYKLDNLVAIVDINRWQSCGSTEDIMPLRDISAKWKSFGWDIVQVDGHSMYQLVFSLHLAKSKHLGLPKVILAETVKGKGVSFMEDDNSWHQKAITDEQMRIAEKEFTGKIS